MPIQFERVVLKRQLGHARPTHDHEAGVKYDGKRKSVQGLAQEPHNTTGKQYITPSSPAQESPPRLDTYSTTSPLATMFGPRIYFVSALACIIAAVSASPVLEARRNVTVPQRNSTTGQRVNSSSSANNTARPINVTINNISECSLPCQWMVHIDRGFL